MKSSEQIVRKIIREELKKVNLKENTSFLNTSFGEERGETRILTYIGGNDTIAKWVEQYPPIYLNTTNISIDEMIVAHISMAKKLKKFKQDFLTQFPNEKLARINEFEFMII